MLYFYDPLHSGGRLMNKALGDLYGDGLLEVDCLAIGTPQKVAKEFRGRNKKSPVKVVSGLFSIRQEQSAVPQESQGEAQRITLLRRPCIRLYAHYLHLRANSGDKRGKSFAIVHKFKRSESFEDFLAKLDKRPYLDNPYTRLFAGADPLQSECNEDMLSKALENLAADFSLVGIAERLDSSVALMAKLLSWESIPCCPLDEVGQDAERQWRELDFEIQTKVHDMLRLDNQIYHWALDRLHALFNEQRSYLGEAAKTIASVRMHSLHLQENSTIKQVAGPA